MFPVIKTNFNSLAPKVSIPFIKFYMHMDNITGLDLLYEILSNTLENMLLSHGQIKCQKVS